MKSNTRLGLAAMLGCFLIWGFQPLYFSLCGEIDTFFLMASRVIWAAICVVILLKLQGKLPQLKAAFRDKALLRREIPAALLMGGDWVVYLWAIQRGKVLECSMAYYIQPLVVFMFGALIYKEKVSWRHIVILAIVIAGIARSSTGFGGVPYVTIVLSLLFAVYAAIKKSIQIDSIVSTSMEILILMPLAILYILFFRTGADGLGALTVVRQLLLCGAGVVTAAPMLFYAIGVRNLPLMTVGICQYLSPTLALVCGLILGETLSAGKLVSFGFIWAGVLLYVLNSVYEEKMAKKAITRS